MSSASACKVCEAKLAGRAPPRRKCSCESGLTSKRNRACAPAANERLPTLADLGLDLIDEEDVCELQQVQLHTGDVVTVFGENPAAADFHQFTKDADKVSEAGDAGAMKSLLSSSVVLSLAARYARSVESLRRDILSHACQTGNITLVAHLLDDGGQLGKMLVSDRCFTAAGSCEAASPLWIAAANGESDLVKMLIARGADPSGAASDGTTPFYAACQHGSVAVLRLLHGCGVDMEQADEADGTSPVHIAAAEGNLEALRFLHKQGVNMGVRGSINLPLGEDGSHTLITGVTALAIAQRLLSAGAEDASGEVVQYLEGIAAVFQPVSAAQPGKRHRSSASTYDRAVSLGIVDRLREIPPRLHEQIESGSELEKKAAKRELHALQKANQKLVSRAEQGRLKQTKLWPQ